jgi:hypothetical protein
VMLGMPVGTKPPNSPSRVIAWVFVCAHDFEVVYVRTADEIQYVLTPDTQGIDITTLREGQAVECLISAGLPRVLSATCVPPPK